MLQAVVCLENMLTRFGTRFVKLVLGLGATAPGVQGGSIIRSLGAAENLSGKKRQRAGSGDQTNDLNPPHYLSNKPFGRNASGKTGSESVSQITPSHMRKATATRSIGTAGNPTTTVEGGAAHRITPSTSASAVRSGRKLTPPTPQRAGVKQLDLQPHLASVQRALVSDLALVWMRLIRSLDSESSLQAPSTREKLTVVLVMRLNALLGGIFRHLSNQDCDFVLADVADTFHEYIFRCNSSSWSVLIKMPENLFGFLESTRNTDSVG